MWNWSKTLSSCRDPTVTPGCSCLLFSSSPAPYYLPSPHSFCPTSAPTLTILASLPDGFPSRMWDFYSERLPTKKCLWSPESKSRWVPSPSQATGAVQLILLERHMGNALNLTWHNNDLSISSLLNFTLTVHGSLIALDFSFETSLIHLAKLHPKLLPSFAFCGLFTRWMCEINHSF